MARAATAFVDFEGDFSKVGRSAGVQSKKLEGTFKSSFRRIAGFATAALAGIGLGKILKDAFGEAQEAQTIARQTAAVLKSTGGAARVSAKDIDTLATSLSNIAAVDDEVIAGGANVLLTFTNIRNEAGKGNDIFNQATTAALNLSAALGTDLQGSVIQIGKALNDPIKGVTALQRVGVSFTKQQKEQIKTLVESGKTLEAQKLILHELGIEFGGAAEAAATPAQRLSVAIGNLQESFGLLFLPVVQKVASFLSEHVAPAIEDLIPKLQRLGGFAKFAFEVGFGSKQIAGITGWLSIFARLGAVIRGFVDFIQGDVVGAGLSFGRAFGLDDMSTTVTKLIKILAVVRKALGNVASFIARNWKPILLGAAAALLVFTAPIVAVVAGLVLLYVRFKLVREAVARFIEFFKRNWPTIRDVALSVIGAVIGAFKLILPLLVDLGRGFAALIGFFRENADVAIALAAPLAAIYLGLQLLMFVIKVQKAFAAFKVALIAVNTVLAANPIILVVAALVALGAAVFLAYKHFGPFHDAVDKVWQILQSTFHWVQENWPLLLAILTGPFGLAIKFILDKFDGPGGLLTFIKKVPGKIAGFLDGMWDGLTKGLAAAWGVVERAFATGVNVVIKIINLLIDAYQNTIGRIPGAPDIGNIDPVSFAISKPKEANMGIGADGVPNSLRKRILQPGDKGFIGPVLPTPGTGHPVNANVVVNGNVFGVDDLDKFADERDRKLALVLRAG